MGNIRFILVFGFAVSATAPCAEIEQARKAEETEYDLDVQILKQAGIGTDGPSLLAYVQKLTGNDEDRAQLRSLLGQLDDKSYKVRKGAQEKLIALGPCILRPLLGMRDSPSKELAERSSFCIREINKTFDWGPIGAAVRRLASLKPQGAFKTLLQYLPYVADDETELDIWYGLKQLLDNEKDARTLLKKALTSSLPARRSLAGALLGAKGSPDEQTAVSRLLHDPRANVRLRAAQGLLAGNNKSGIPELIALLNDPSLIIAWQAEELLHWVAGKAAPREKLGAGMVDSRMDCKRAWTNWVTQNRTKIDLELRRAAFPAPGLYLLYEPLKPMEYGGVVWLTGCDGSLRWHMPTPNDAVSIQLLGEQRILLGEVSLCKNAKRLEPCGYIVERTLTGKLVSTINRGKPASVLKECRRLPNGHTLVVDWDCMLDFDLNNKATSVCPLGAEFSFASGFLIANHEVVAVSSRFDSLIHFGSQARHESRISKKDNGNGRVHWNIRMLSDGNALAVEEFSSRRNGSDPRDLIPEMKQVIEINQMAKPVCRFLLREGVAPVRRSRNKTYLILCKSNEKRLVEATPSGRAICQIYSLYGGISTVTPCLEMVRFGFETPSRPDLDLDSVTTHVKALLSPNVQTRRRAAQALRGWRQKAIPALPALFPALGDMDSEVRYDAFATLHGFGTRVQPTLSPYLHDSNPFVRIHCLSLLWQFGEDKSMVLRELNRGFRDKNPDVRDVALTGLINRETNESRLASILIKGLDDQDRKVRLTAIFEADYLGTKVKKALPHIMLTLKEKDRVFRNWAIIAVGKVGQNDPAAIAALIGILKDKDTLVDKPVAAGALSYSGLKAAAAVGILLDLCKGPEHEFRETGSIHLAAVETLGEIGAGSKRQIQKVFTSMAMAYPGKGLLIKKIAASYKKLGASRMEIDTFYAKLFAIVRPSIRSYLQTLKE